MLHSLSGNVLCCTMVSDMARALSSAGCSQAPELPAQGQGGAPCAPPVEVQHPLFEALGIKLFDQAFNPEWPLYSADYVDWLHVAWRLKYQVRVIATQNSCGWCQGGVNAGAAQQRVLPLSVGDVVMLSCSAANMLT